jgi:heme exporter protein D
VPGFGYDQVQQEKRMNLGPHADFIVAAYVVTIFVIAALVAWVMLDYSAQRRILGDLEEHRITRRSQRKGQ